MARDRTCRLRLRLARLWKRSCGTTAPDATVTPTVSELLEPPIQASEFPVWAQPGLRAYQSGIREHGIPIAEAAHGHSTTLMKNGRVRVCRSIGSMVTQPAGTSFSWPSASISEIVFGSFWAHPIRVSPHRSARLFLIVFFRLPVTTWALF